MQFGEALTRASRMVNHGMGWRGAVGSYPNGATVHVTRAEEHDARCINLAYVVTIASPFAGKDSKLADGVDAAKMHLRVRHLPVTIADWTVEPLALREERK